MQLRYYCVRLDPGVDLNYEFTLDDISNMHLRQL